MMKTQLLKTFAILMLFSLSDLMAQEVSDITIVMNPGDFTPHDDGYYIAGVDKDLVGDDGIPEHYDGCFDAYGDADHKESGTQNDWEYGSVIIFRDCDTSPETADDAVKGTQPEENWPTEGNMIQLSKHKYALTDTATFGYMVSPEFTSISSLEVKVSTDVSINANRTIWMLVEASKDGGETWEYINNPDGTEYIYQQLTNQGGDIHTYTAGTNEGFDAIAAASAAGPIQLRFMPMPPPGASTDITNGERLKLWEITIQAKTAPEEPQTVLGTEVTEGPAFTIRNGAFIAAKRTENLHVYTLSGALVGSGNRVQTCGEGLYIVKASDGTTKKIYLK